MFSPLVIGSAGFKGFTEMLPGQITTDTLISSDGKSFLKLLANQFKFGNENSGIDWNVSKQDQLLIKNASFNVENKEGLVVSYIDGNSGKASFSKGNVILKEDGDVYVKGQIEATSGIFRGALITPYFKSYTSGIEWANPDKGLNISLINSNGVILPVWPSLDGVESDIIYENQTGTTYISLPNDDNKIYLKNRSVRSIGLRGKNSRVRLRAFIPRGRTEYVDWLILNTADFELERRTDGYDYAMYISN